MNGIFLETLADIYKKQEEMMKRLEELAEPKKQKLFTVEDLVEILGVSRRTISTWTKEQRLPHTKVGNKIWVTENQLQAFILKNSSETPTNTTQKEGGVYGTAK